MKRKLSILLLSFSLLALGLTPLDTHAATPTKTPRTKHAVVHHRVKHKAAVHKATRHPISMNQSTFYGLPSTGDNCDGQCMLSSLDTTIVAPAMALTLPSLISDEDLSMYRNTAIGAYADKFTITQDTVANDYYAMYVTPTVVTVGGFNVPVTGTATYYSPFKHRHGTPMRLHNHKGEDATAQYGVSPRAGSYPESIEGTTYSATPVER